MELLPRNEAILKRRFPEVLRRIREGSYEKSDYVWEKGALVKYSGTEGTRYIYGNRDPEGLIDRWVSSLNIQKGGCYACCGIGTGLHLEGLLKEASKDAHFFVVEKDLGWLKEVLSQYDISELLDDKRLTLSSGEVNEKMFHGLHEWHLHLLKDVGVILYAPLFEIGKSYYNKALKEFVRYLGAARNLHQTNIWDSGLWQETTFKNLKYFLKAPDVGVMRDVFKDLPVVLVAAGPSLDDSLDFLKKAKEKAVIVCVNSAYRTLIKNGIRPHITIAADPRERAMRGILLKGFI